MAFKNNYTYYSPFNTDGKSVNAEWSALYIISDKLSKEGKGQCKICYIKDDVPLIKCSGKPKHYFHNHCYDSIKKAIGKCPYCTES